MNKILIVDDNKNNRMILHLLLDDYLDKHKEFLYHIDEAENGESALEMVKNVSYDIVLMDIMMPKMDGIEATKLIKKINKNIMIIAISAMDDIDRQREILNAGAEDYLSKPINADIFTTRIGHYFSLIESRNHKKFNLEAINNYTKEIFSRRLVFMIASDDDLSEFWEYYLLGDNERYEYLSDTVRVIYALCDLLLKLDEHCEVIVEESENERYYTITNIDKLDDELIMLVMMKNRLVDNYKIKNARISFMLCITSEQNITQKSEVDVTSVNKESATQEVEVVKNSVYDYIDEDDLEELEIYISKLNSLLLIIGSGNVEDDEIVEIYTYLELIAKILITYSESKTVGDTLLELSDVIAKNIDVFRKNSAALAPMAKAFSSDLQTWNRTIFHDGAPSVDYLDDTICANSKTISLMLSPQEESAEEELDDIFDF